MNQILSTNSGKKSKEPLSIKTITRIFAIIIILFGMILVGQGSWAMFNGEESGEVQESVPVVQMVQEGNSLKVTLQHDKAIDRIVYSLNGGQEVVLQGRGRTQIEESIPLEIGDNTIYLTVSDLSGKEVSYDGTYFVEEGDTTPPQIELILEDGRVKISAKDETQIAYILYYWNEEDETRLDARAESPTLIEERLSVLRGENTLTVVAVDTAGNETTEVQTYKGATKPQISLSREGDELIIKVTDEENIQKIEFTLNGVFYSTDANNTGTPLNMKEIEIRQKLNAGTNTITVTAYNVSGLTQEGTGEVTVE